MAWDARAYGRFADARLRPAADLLGRVPDELPPGDVVDLGCGAGAAGPLLAARFPDRRLLGVDASSAMLSAADGRGCYAELVQDDLRRWQPARPPALIFANASLNWVDGHDSVLPALARRLAPGGLLAVQMPNQTEAPSHALWRELARAWLPEARIAALCPPPLLPGERYLTLLRGLGTAELWETIYHQQLSAGSDGHPVRRFTEATYARPLLQALPRGDADALIAAYEREVVNVYPLRDDGVLFPFRRLFFTLRL